ncbi:MAG: hypothetical protein QM760_12580 [Nibricoccus sp.]
MPDSPTPKQYPCPTCGSEARWDPAEHALVCISCETRAPADDELNGLDGQDIKEHILTLRLRNAPDSERGWQSEKQELRCETCGAISVLDQDCMTGGCTFCGSSVLSSYTELKPSLRPESVLPFKITESQVRESVRMWYGRQWLAPAALKTRAMTDTVRGMYIPCWTFDARASAHWTATTGSGENRSIGFSGNEESGHVEVQFDDVLVPASQGLNHDMLTELEPFPTNELKPYHPGFLAGWPVERYHLDLANAAVLGRQRMDRQMKSICAERNRNQKHRGLQISTNYSEQTFKHVLVPVWILNYLFAGEPYQVLVNGYTGKITGSFPVSRAKISTCAIAAVAVALPVAFYHPVLVTLGAVAALALYLSVRRSYKSTLETFPSSTPPYVRSLRPK